MKATPLLVNFHDDRAPIYSVHFEPHGKGRLATAGGDNNVRIWQVDSTGDERKLTYLSTLKKHTQAVNVVRWCPRGELLASAGDDGNILLWAPADPALASTGGFGEEDDDNKEAWMVKKMCRSQTGSEIYDLAWSPDGAFFIAGSMDNVARIFDSSTGNVIRQIAEHNHYVQGVAWDPLNEYIATQSSDRSVHIYKLKTSDGQFSLSNHGRVSRMDIHSRRLSQESSAPSDHPFRAPSFVSENTPHVPSSPGPSAPGTPMSVSLPMNPPAAAAPHSRRSSFGAASPSIARSASPAPSLPLPAVMPAASPNPLLGISVRNTSLYANETLTSFFRRLTFTPDGSLLLTPAGQYKTSNLTAADAAKITDDIMNTVYIYSRGGLNKPPIAHLPGHKKPSVAVKCSPILYNHRLPTSTTKQITIDTSSAVDDMTPLPDPVLPSATSMTAMRFPPTQSTLSSMEPPPISLSAAATTMPSPSPSTRAASPRPVTEGDNAASASSLGSGPQPVFSLPYRIIYAVATQDSVYVYDTQQQSPICTVSNLHFATFTDLAWSNDGLTLLMSSSDGFCSSLNFTLGELGTTYHGTLNTRLNLPAAISTSGGMSASSTPIPTPTASSSGTKLFTPAVFAPSPSPTTIPSRPSPQQTQNHSHESKTQPRPSSPTRSNSASSIATQSSIAIPATPYGSYFIHHATPSVTNLPSVVAGGASGPPSALSPGQNTGTGSATSPTPPMTPLPNSATSNPSTSGTASISFSNALFPAPPPPLRATSQTPFTAATSASASAATGSTNSVIPQKREVDETQPKTEQTEGMDAPTTKKRRVAPTLVSSASDVSSDTRRNGGVEQSAGKS